ncbi:hypothetical protein CB1_001888002 [Camelus ferus]|nr:hypothetical protein CB1_001888002 [Camelus ferus]
MGSPDPNAWEHLLFPQQVAILNLLSCPCRFEEADITVFSCRSGSSHFQETLELLGEAISGFYQSDMIKRWGNPLQRSSALDLNTSGDLEARAEQIKGTGWSCQGAESAGAPPKLSGLKRRLLSHEEEARAVRPKPQVALLRGLWLP